MPMTFVIRFKVVPEERERFLSLLEGVLDSMRDEPMFHEAVLHRDPENENHFMLYETWEDLDDVVNVQLERPYRRAWHAALPEILAEPRDISSWLPLRADRREPSPPAPLPFRSERGR
jgi:quinol monooxygenase YgiN